MTSPSKALTALVSPASYLLGQSQKAGPAAPALPDVPPPAPPASDPSSKPGKKSQQQSFLSGVAGSTLNQGGGASGKTLLGQ